MSGYTRQEVAQRAGVDPDYLDHLVELGITAVVRWGSHDGRWPFQARDGAGQRAELALFAAAGVGGWAGLLAAGFSQLLGFPALPVLAFAYLFGMSRLRGWKELAGLLSLMTVVVVYFAAHDVIRAVDLGVWGIAGEVVGAAVLAFILTYLVAVLVVRVRAHALATPPRGLFGRPRREPVPAEDHALLGAGPG